MKKTDLLASTLAAILFFICNACDSDEKNNGDPFPDIPESYVLSPETVSANSLAGNGTPDSPFLIRNAMDFKYFIESVNSGTLRPIDEDEQYSGRMIVSLMHDIEISDDYNWIPICFPDNSPGMDFNGGSHTISGSMRMRKELYLDMYLSVAGLFGNAEYLYINNLNVSANLIPSALSGTPRNFLAGIIIADAKSGQLDNVTVSGKLTIMYHTGNMSGLGGFCGRSMESSYSNCKMEGKFEFVPYPGKDKIKLGEYLYLGGITGLSQSVATESYRSCYNYSDISVKNVSLSELSVGGIIGCRQTSTGSTAIPDLLIVENLGDITISNVSWIKHNESSPRAIYVGGLYGRGGQGEECGKIINNADISVSKVAMPAYVGGIAGWCDFGAYIGEATNAGNITNNGDSGYTGGCYGCLYADAKHLFNLGNVSSTIEIKGNLDNWDDFIGSTGGIVGYLPAHTIKESSNSGNITTPSPFIHMDSEVSYGGGIIGRGSERTKIVDCTNYGSINNSTDNYGTENGFTWLALKKIAAGKWDKESAGYKWWYWYIFG